MRISFGWLTISPRRLRCGLTSRRTCARSIIKRAVRKRLPMAEVVGRSGGRQFEEELEAGSREQEAVASANSPA